MAFYESKHLRDYEIPLNEAPDYQGGRTLIQRLMQLFKVESRLELGDLLGVTQGTISTWMTRNTTPYEILMRVHLATKVPLEYLCFGNGSEVDLNELVPAEKKALAPSVVKIDLFEIKNGKLQLIKNCKLDEKICEPFNLTTKDLLITDYGKFKFVNTDETTVTRGEYLMSVNGIYQFNELMRLPDGMLYFILEGSRIPLDYGLIEIHGKVTAVLEKI